MLGSVIRQGRKSAPPIMCVRRYLPAVISIVSLALSPTPARCRCHARRLHFRARRISTRTTNTRGKSRASLVCTAGLTVCRKQLLPFSLIFIYTCASVIRDIESRQRRVANFSSASLSAAGTALRFSSRPCSHRFDMIPTKASPSCHHQQCLSCNDTVLQ